MTKTKEIKDAIRNKFAWPGGYPLYLVTDDGAALCVECGKKEYKQIAWSIMHNVNDGWKVVAPDVNWEDTDLFCDHCNKQIESAYAEDNVKHVWSSSMGKIELEIPKEAIDACSHSGSCDADVAEWTPKLDWSNVTREAMESEMKDLGAWDDLKTVDIETLKQRVTWVACNDLKEERD